MSQITTGTEWIGALNRSKLVFVTVDAIVDTGGTHKNATPS
ncbi:hypothetical protein [Microlunatus endophyticus]|nr:hypothetical protein [Microlunatus endophyticus]